VAGQVSVAVGVQVVERLAEIGPGEFGEVSVLEGPELLAVDPAVPVVVGEFEEGAGQAAEGVLTGDRVVGQREVGADELLLGPARATRRAGAAGAPVARC